MADYPRDGQTIAMMPGLEIALRNCAVLIRGVAFALATLATFGVYADEQMPASSATAATTQSERQQALQSKTALEVANQHAQNGQLEEALRTLERGLQALPEAWAMHQAIQAIHLRHAARAYAQAVGLPMPPAALQLLPEGAKAASVEAETNPAIAPQLSTQP